MLFGDGDPVTLPWWVTAFSIAAVPIFGEGDPATPWWIAGGTVLGSLAGTGFGALWKMWRDGKADNVRYLIDALDMYKADNLRWRNLASESLETIECHRTSVYRVREGLIRERAKAEAYMAGWERANADLIALKQTVETIPPLRPLDLSETEEMENRTRTAQANTAITQAASETVRGKPPSSKPSREVASS